jgi:FkbM family methyltransferase
MQDSKSGTFFGTLHVLFNKGIRYSTVIDVGSADGHFFLMLCEEGIAPGAAPFNIDANRLYEDSLKAIKAAVGGDFFIGAVTNHEGEIELTTSVHPYWSSLRPKDDPYWTRINNLSSAKTVVPATTLDTLRHKFKLKPPFLLKLDVQGAEHEAFSGGANVLKDTHVVICEADVDDFQRINDILLRHGFVLYDLVNMARAGDGALGWFYPIYVNRALEHIRPKQFWDSSQNAAVIDAQVQRRQAILKLNANILARIRDQKRAVQDPAAADRNGRNDPCPCGSGKKYKHCCGALA